MKLRAYSSDSYLYSDSFPTLLYTLQHDGKNIEQNVEVRFYISRTDILFISLTDTGAPDKDSEGKTIDVKLGIRSPNGTWGLRSILLGKAQFSSMAEVYEYEDYDSRYDPYKIIVRDKGKNILALMRGTEDKTTKIQEACHKFKDCRLKYQNDLLGSVNSKGEFNPLFRRVIKTYTPLVRLQTDLEATRVCKHWENITKDCHKWLQKNYADWLVIEPPKQTKRSKKRKVETYSLNLHIDFMAKQTVEWGNPVFTDTAEKQPVTLDVIKAQLESNVVDNIQKTWLALQQQLLSLYVEQYFDANDWASMSNLQQKDAVIRIRTIFQTQIQQPHDLFNPSQIALAGASDELPPQAIWFRIIEAFYRSVGIGLVYTDYQEPTIIEPDDYELQEATETVDKPLTHNYAISDQSVSPPDPIDLLSEELASTDFFDDVNDREEIKRYIVWRRGQPEFRRKLLDAYGCCAITGCISEEALEAAHIKPYSDTQNNDSTNGLLLRADIHTLFDRHLIGIDSETMTVCVAQSLLEDYGQFNGKSLQLPEDKHLRPDKDALRIRYEEYKKRLDGYDQ